MTSNLFSRLLPQSTTPSIYDTLRQAAEQSDDSDVEERAGLARDDFSDDMQAGRYTEEDLHDDQQAGLLHRASFRDESPVNLRSSSRPSQASSRSPEWRRGRSKATEEDEANDDVPLSLLVEGDSPEASPTGFKRLPPRPSDETGYVPVHERPLEDEDWGSATQRGMRDDHHRTPAYAGRPPVSQNPLLLANEREKAMWRWTNVIDLDQFLKEVYSYYMGKGFHGIILSQILDLLTIAFVVGFGLFLTTCVDYGQIPGSQKLSQILVPKCTQRMSGFKYVVVFCFSIYWFASFASVLVDVPRLWRMRNFFTYLLDIPDSDIQTVNWQQVVGRLMTLRDQNATTATDTDRKTRRYLGTQSKQRMDAHDIANRLMRRENYLIAMVNKGVLDLKIQIPYVGDYHVLTRAAMWNLSFSIFDMVFSNRGQVNPVFLTSTQRNRLIESVQRRFRYAAVVTMIFAPLQIIYSILLFFFKYFQEYQKNPGRLGLRDYSPLATWKFREFNELEHLLQRRLKLSQNIANMYLNHWPKYKTVLTAHFVGLIAGALASVLVLASLWDPDLFLGFEITPNRTALFYTTFFAAVWTAARNVEDEDAESALPDEAMELVCSFTHYRPSHWEGQLHSDDVRKEFAALYKPRLIIFFEELLSIILLPYLLWFNLPACTPRIVDFFREFTVHVDGLGYVCSFALFDFKSGRPNTTDPNVAPTGGAPGKAGAGPNDASDPRDDYFATKDNKMMSSYMHFMDAYHHDPTGRKNMAQLAHFRASHRNRHFHPPPAFPGLNTSGMVGGGSGGSGGGSGGVATGIDVPISPVTERRPGISRGSRIEFANTAGMLRSQRTPHFSATRGSGMDAMPSPGASMLLDPAHQPSPAMLAGQAAGAGSMFRPGRSAAQSQLRKSRLATVSARDDVIGEEDAEEEDFDALIGQGSSGGRAGAGDGRGAGRAAAAAAAAAAAMARTGSGRREQRVQQDPNTASSSSNNINRGGESGESSDQLDGSWKTTRGGTSGAGGEYYDDDEDGDGDDESGARRDAVAAQDEGGMLGLIAQFSKAQARGGGVQI